LIGLVLAICNSPARFLAGDDGLTESVSGAQAGIATTARSSTAKPLLFDSVSLMASPVVVTSSV
jgi:hypothetical protein